MLSGNECAVGVVESRSELQCNQAGSACGEKSTADLGVKVDILEYNRGSPMASLQAYEVRVSICHKVKISRTCDVVVGHS
jgi:hypothetical protein